MEKALNTKIMMVVASMNLKDDTITCLDSLIQAGAVPEQIIVVDNASTDGTVEAIRGRYQDKISIIANPENIGLAGASNRGAALAYQKGAEWILLLNNDTEFAPDFFTQIEKAIDLGKGYQLFHPAVMYYSDPEMIWHMGSKRIPGTLIYKDIYQGKRYSPDWPDLIPVDAASSCALLIKREAYEKIGLFDPKFFIYWEEVDLCWRAYLAGFHVAAMPKVKMWHKVSKTMNRVKARTRYLQTRNQLYFYRKNTRGLQRPVMLLFSIYKSIVNGIRDLLNHQPELIRSMADGWRDGWRGF